MPRRAQYRIEDAADLYRSGATLDAVSAQFGCCKKTLATRLRRHGVRVPTSAEARTKWTPERIAIAQAYSDKGHSSSEIAKFMGTTKGAVMGARRDHGLRLMLKPGGDNDRTRHAVIRANTRRPLDNGGGLARQIRSRIRAEQFGIAKAPVIVPSSVEIIGPIAGEDIPGRLECRWIEGEVGQGGRYCAQAVHELRSYCPHHFSRVFNYKPEPAPGRRPLAEARLWR